MIVKDVKVHVKTSSTPPTDSSGGNGLGGLTVAIVDLWAKHNEYACLVSKKETLDDESL